MRPGQNLAPVLSSEVAAQERNNCGSLAPLTPPNCMAGPQACGGFGMTRDYGAACPIRHASYNAAIAMNQFFNWLKDAGTQAIMVLVSCVAACLAAFFAFYFGRKSLTKRDLAPLEQNTAATSGHLENVHTHLANLNERAKRQEDADDLVNRAKWIPISVSGNADANMPLSIRLTTTQANVYFMRVELLSENSNVYGYAECLGTGNLLQRTAEFPPDMVNRWRAAGTAVNMSVTRHLLRVWMRFSAEPREVPREMPVTLTSGLRGGGKDAPGINVPTLEIEGAA